jgi:amino-acid N-acetyltransferase
MLPCSFGPIVVRSAHLGDLPEIGRLMAPLVARGELLERSEGEMWSLLPQSFLAEVDGRAVGFAALEVYSQKMSEIQCLSYEESAPAPDVIAALLHVCLGQAREHHILEVMAVVPPHLEATLTRCGFYVILPGQKTAMFLRTGCGSTVAGAEQRVAGAERSGAPAGNWGTAPLCPDSHPVVIRPADLSDAADVARFLAPFVARGELLPRTAEELLTLLRHGFVAEAQGRIVGFTALEIYSDKLAEVQCVSVDEAFRGHGIGRRLVTLCVDRARQFQIAETLAISAREEVLRSCGFNHILPGAKVALFVRNG